MGSGILRLTEEETAEYLETKSVVVERRGFSIIVEYSSIDEMDTITVVNPYDKIKLNFGEKK